MNLPADAQEAIDVEADRCGIERTVLTYVIGRLVDAKVLVLPSSGGALTPDAEARMQLGQFAAAMPATQVGDESQVPASTQRQPDFAVDGEASDGD